MEIDEIHKKEGKNLRYYQIYAGKGFKNKAKTHNTVDCYNKLGNEDKCPHRHLPRNHLHQVQTKIKISHLEHS